MWFVQRFDADYAKANYLESVSRLRTTLNSLDGSSLFLAAGGQRPASSQRGGTVGPFGKGPVSDSIMGLAKKHEFEYRAPFRTLDTWERNPMEFESAAGDPDFAHLFGPQMVDETGAHTMVRAAPGGGISIRSVFAMTLACALTKLSDVASARDIYELYQKWPIIMFKKPRQKKGAGSAEASRWRRNSWWGFSSSYTDAWGGSWEEGPAAPGPAAPGPAAHGEDDDIDKSHAVHRRTCPSPTESDD